MKRDRWPGAQGSLDSASRRRALDFVACQVAYLLLSTRPKIENRKSICEYDDEFLTVDTHDRGLRRDIPLHLWGSSTNGMRKRCNAECRAMGNRG